MTDSDVPSHKTISADTEVQTADRIVPLRHPLRTTVSVVFTLLALIVLYSVCTNPRFQWDVVAEYFLSPQVLKGLGNTLLLTLLSMIGAIVLGVVLAIMRVSRSRVLRWFSAAYIWLFRGTPLLVQLIIFFNISALYPEIALSVPGLGTLLGPININVIMTPFIVAVLALATNEAAYMAEIVRGGLVSVSPGQAEAAKALGMSPVTVFFRVVLPQAMRFIVPPTGNQVISMLKSTSLVSVIAYTDLLYSVQAIYARTFETIPLLLVASLQYLLVTTVLMIIQHFIEQHYGAGNRRQSFRSRTRQGAPDQARQEK